MHGCEWYNVISRYGLLGNDREVWQVLPTFQRERTASNLQNWGITRLQNVATYLPCVITQQTTTQIFVALKIWTLMKWKLCPLILQNSPWPTFSPEKLMIGFMRDHTTATLGTLFIYMNPVRIFSPSVFKIHFKSPHLRLCHSSGVSS